MAWIESKSFEAADERRIRTRPRSTSCGLAGPRSVVSRSSRASALTTNVRALCGGGAWAAPSPLLFAANAGAVPAFGFEDLWVTGVLVAPAQVLAERAAECGVVGIVAVRDHELAQRPEMRLDRVRP